MELINLQILIKKAWNKINCFCGRHMWSEILDFNYSNNSRYFYYKNRQLRHCIYCGKEQYRESSLYKEFSEIYKEKWKNFTMLYETDTQKVHKTAKKLSNDAAIVTAELSKFDSCVKQRTKTFMHLVNAARRLSNEFMDLKTEIRELHIKKQKDDINKAESN